MGDHCPVQQLVRVSSDEIPFGNVIIEIEEVRNALKAIQTSQHKDSKEQELIIELEEKLRTAYAKLAAKAATKVANWAPSPKHPL